MKRIFPWLVLAGAAWLLPAPGPAWQGKDEKVFRRVSIERLEGLLNEFGVRYKKTTHKKMDDVHFYDYDKNGYAIRIGNWSGRDLWIDCVFNRQPLELINQWNVRAKYSRAVLSKLDGRDQTIVEAQLDCVGGVTDGMIRQFILRFDDELKAFDQFIQAQGK